MSKLNIRKAFQNKTFKYGGFATLMAIVVIAIVIALNLVVDQLNLKVDLSKDKLYSLSEQSYKVLDSLNKKVNIIVLEESGKENTLINEVVGKYKNRSKNITVDHKDPVLYPQLSKKYGTDGKTLSAGSIIVEAENKFKVIDGVDLYNFNSQTQQVESLAVEKNLTGAIMYATSENNPVAYVLKGHNEEALPSDLVKQMEIENVEKKDIDNTALIKGDFKPKAGDILIVCSPKRDLASEEEQKIREFLSNSGRAVFLMDVVTTDMPNFQKLFASYGVSVQKALTIETNPAYIAKSPIYLVPKMANNNIVSSISSADLKVIMPAVQPIEILNMKKQSLKIEPLLTTSDKAYGKKNLQDTNLDKESGDINGPLNLALTISETPENGDKQKETRIVVMGTSKFLDPQVNAMSSGSNNDLLLNSLNWLKNEDTGIAIRPKSLKREYLNITQLQALVSSGIVVIVIPVTIFVIGLVVWLKRRNL